MLTPISPEILLTPRNGWSLLAAASLGGLVGLVRQWNQRDRSEASPGFRAVAGARTFALWSTFGFVAAQLERAGVPWMLLAGMAAVAALLTASTFRHTDDPGGAGLTTTTSGMLTYVTGALLGADLTRYAVWLAIILAGIIGVRRLTAEWSGRLNETDVRAGLQFAFLTGVILPLVPDEKLWGVFNPYDTWRMVMLVAGVNLTGYATMRFLGQRAGTALTGLVGGIGSSTAVTLAFARHSRENPAQGAIYAQGVLLACTVMVPRLLFILSAINPELAAALLPCGALVCLATAVVPAWIWLRERTRAEDEVPAVGNPLRLAQSAKFALLYAVVVFLLDASRDFAGASGLYALSFISGLPDMDAITLSLAGRTSAGELSANMAAMAVLVAIAANTLVKLSLAFALGSGRFRSFVAAGLALPLLVILARVLFS